MILQREGAEKDYTDLELQQVRELDKTITEAEKDVYKRQMQPSFSINDLPCRFLVLIIAQHQVGSTAYQFTCNG